MQLVDLRCDAPDRLIAPKGKPEVRLGMLKERIVFGIEMDLPFGEKRCHPLRVVFVELHRKAMECTPQIAAFDRDDPYVGAFGGCL
jgi:hypothetical protein